MTIPTDAEMIDCMNGIIRHYQPQSHMPGIQKYVDTLFAIRDRLAALTPGKDAEKVLRRVLDIEDFGEAIAFIQAYGDGRSAAGDAAGFQRGRQAGIEEAAIIAVEYATEAETCNRAETPYWSVKAQLADDITDDIRALAAVASASTGDKG